MRHDPRHTHIEHCVCATIGWHQLLPLCIDQKVANIVHGLHTSNVSCTCTGKQSLPMSSGISQGMHASNVVCSHQLADIDHGMHALDVICVHVSNDVSQLHQLQRRTVSITHGLCASVGWHLSWPASTGKCYMTSTKSCMYQALSVCFVWATLFVAYENQLVYVGPGHARIRRVCTYW